MPQRMKQKRSSKNDKNEKTITDPRFRNIQTDPRYRLPRRADNHVKLDKRFEHMLKDEDFTQKSTVDRYGRRLADGAGKKALERFYRVEDENESKDEDEDKDEDEEEVESSQEEQLEKSSRRVEPGYDPAREGGFSESSSDEDEDEEGSSDGSEELDVFEDAEATEGFGDDGEQMPIEEASSRIAIVNLDWDNIRAVDIMAVASSFCPSGGRVLKVSVLPSEYGRERMEQEDLDGPPREFFLNSKAKKEEIQPEEDEEEYSDDSGNQEGDEKIKQKLLKEATEPTSEVDSKALRAYQLSRLRYYYAVVACDSTATALAVYNDMDGREYLSTANFFDIRFIPDSVTFDDPITDKPREECTKVPEDYRPNEFVTEALTHSKVRLTWDEEDQSRKEVQKRAFSRKDIDDNDLKAYVGSDSSEEEDDRQPSTSAHSKDANAVEQPKLSKADAARQKIRLALGLPIDEPEQKLSDKKKSLSSSAPSGDMQVTFKSFASEPAKAAPTNEATRNETTREAYLRKEKDRKARRKANAKARRGEDASPSPPPEKDAQDEEDPFADSFFENPIAANSAAKKAAKKEKLRVEAAKEAATADQKAKERAELELLMADDDDANGTGPGSHFNMAEVRRAEKAAGAKGKNQKKKKKPGVQDPAAGMQDFEIDAQDERFRGLFESHEYAIDPSHARFSGTKAMKGLLEEGRRKRDKREVQIGQPDVDEQSLSKKRKDVRSNAQHGDKDDISALVDKVKRRKIAAA